ncbi:MAG TPA: bifunctional phosphopantothenoylcysteine decarboxylase/phosphopantothenate--cysteine ligase CoaBC [Candidatus Limnocylindrales bacterium]|nr:bifunctional phosphopantothenoylcysteine decarboxylase/phosphopantothenate--cysteine ligase CoaBC [Candidatus Limnocylindrales bacterium]
MSARRLAGRLIALGVTGSIAAYKAPEIVRRLQDEGADVVALLTPSAARFVAPLALEALTRHAVDADVTGLLADRRIGHIVVADTADAVLVAPATAHWLGAMANGLAADAVTATCLATTAPVVVAPAMDGEMYAHPATQSNVARLRDAFGYAIVEPDAGPLASGQTGIGRLAASERLVEAVVRAVEGSAVRQPDASLRPPAVEPAHEADLEGRPIVVTAGGTAEPIDPVRVITNRSTGRMGVAVAEAALARGARVTLIAGNVSVPLPAGADVVRAGTAGEMRAALLRALAGHDGQAGFDVLVMAAAVSDFRPATLHATKIARGESLTLALEPTPDLLAEISRIVRGEDAAGAPTRRPLDPRPVLVGFAAETGSLERAPDKLRRKGVDLLVANDVAEPGSGFGTDTNRVTILAADGARDELPLITKREVADLLLDRVAALLDARDAERQTGPVSPEVTR